VSPRRDIYSRADLSPKEQNRIRVAIRFLRVRLGSWEILARALKFTAPTLIHVCAERRPVSPTMCFRVARFVNIGIDDLLAGKFHAPGMCPKCGSCEKGEP